jgi:hypothetical protein
MKNESLIKLLSEYPLDYNVVLSKFLRVILDEKAEMTNEVFDMVVDDPITSIAVNEEDKEIRFILSTSDKEALKNITEGKWRKI